MYYTSPHGDGQARAWRRDDEGGAIPVNGLAGYHWLNRIG